MMTDDPTLANPEPEPELGTSGRIKPSSFHLSLADRLAAMRDDIRQNALPNKGDEKDQWLRTFDEAVEALREKDAEIGRLKNHHEATIAQTDRVLRKKDRRIAELEDALRAIDTDTHNVVDATLNGIGGTDD